MSYLYWYDIPSSDIDRAAKFYSKVFEIELPEPQTFKGNSVIMLPKEFGGTLVSGGMYQPGSSGITIYLNVGEAFEDIYGRIEEAGGKIVMPKFQKDESTTYCYFEDSEGNKIGLASVK